MRLLKALLAAAIALSTPSSTSSTPSTTISNPNAFTYNRTHFLLHNKPFVIVGGQMDPQRIPPDLWRRRLHLAKAMGINTIFSYTFWNDLEPRQGKWTGSKYDNNITDFVQAAHEEGLYIVLRPGPYICGERDWGGLPSWLANIPGLVPRSFNAPFLDATWSYLYRLARDLSHLQVTHGGPILMVQVENEYGSYGDDGAYKLALRNMTSALFDVPLYTTDGGSEIFLRGGQIPGVLAVVDGGPEGFPIRDKVITDNSSLGPQIDGETYIVKSDQWGPHDQHYTTVNNNDLVDKYIKNLNTTLSANNSFNFYMLHGGTNFGFSTGSLFNGNRTAPWTTSYDHGAPIDEAGRPTHLYHTLREEILKYLPDRSTVPEPPADIPLMALEPVTLSPYASILDTVTHKTTKDDPVPMEALNQAYGFILYEHEVQIPINGTLQPGDRPRDRAIVYVNNQRKGTIDSFYAQPAIVTLSLKPGDKLQLLVENVGRTNYWYKESNVPNLLLDPYKGINGSISVGGSILKRWKISQIPCIKPPPLKSVIEGGIQKGILPVYYSGKFSLPRLGKDDVYSSMDTYLSIEGGVRGIVWVNGFNLGRYWVVGPQQSLYLPGVILKPGLRNKITVLEMKPWDLSLTARGETTRTWANNPDPDAPQ